MPPKEPSLPLLRLGRATLKLGWPRPPSRRPDQWLRVHARVDCPLGHWSFTDESLTVAEAEALIDWLRAPTTRSAPTFIEPCLSFAASSTASTSAPDSILLAITFKGEASPPWIRGTDEVWEGGWTLRGETTLTQLQRFANELARMQSQ